MASNPLLCAFSGTPSSVGRQGGGSKGIAGPGSATGLRRPLWGGSGGFALVVILRSGCRGDRSDPQASHSRRAALGERRSLPSLEGMRREDPLGFDRSVPLTLPVLDVLLGMFLPFLLLGRDSQTMSLKEHPDPLSLKGPVFHVPRTSPGTPFSCPSKAVWTYRSRGVSNYWPGRCHSSGKNGIFRAGGGWGGRCGWDPIEKGRPRGVFGQPRRRTAR
jgi:hypothetical protein